MSNPTKRVRNLEMEDIFDTLLGKLSPFKTRLHRPIQIYRLQDIVPFLTTSPTTYRAGFSKLIFLEKGSMRQKIDGTVNVLSENSVLFVKKGHIFSLENFGKVTEGFIIFFSPEALGEALKIRYLAKAVEINPVLLLDTESVAWFKDACELLLAQFDASPPSSLPISAYLLSAMVLKLIDLSAMVKRKWSRKEEIAYNFRRRVLDNRGVIQEVQTIADELNVSQSYLYRCVKEVTGRSPKRWLLDAALLNGRTLLQQGKLSITQVSRESGFDDPSYFGRLFKQHFGITPREFQQENRSKLVL